ncbi:MAG: glutamate--tRNA ligase [Bdellovibrionota bacterium]|jgi:glutamyl-tRNA synthetase
MVRVRFAPSPTGFAHIGNFRTAIFAWLFARKHGGQFLLRIEDTDRERLVSGAVRYIIESLQWLGLNIDEGPSVEELKKIGEYWDEAPQLGGASAPYVQSLRVDRYKAVAEELIAAGYAYRCDCTAERLAAERAEQEARKESHLGYSGYCRERHVSAESKHVVRFKIPDSLHIKLQDLALGEISWDEPPLADPVLLKSDGMPTYHLASVVDDHAMEITHVMRGQEWISTTPLHLLLYKACGWDPPHFCHLPLILGPDGKKLSKRHGAEPLDVIRDKGFLPEAVLNFVTLIGWNPGDEREIFNRDELIEAFSLERLNPASGVFDVEKLLWMNGMYIRALPPQEFAKRALPYIEKSGLKVDLKRWEMIAPHVQERAKVLPDVVERVDFLFKDVIERDTKAMFKKGMDEATAKVILHDVAEALSKLDDFSVEAVETCLRKLVEEKGWNLGSAFGVIRIAVTGKTVTPPLFESIVALGKEDTLKRLQEAL